MLCPVGGREAESILSAGGNDTSSGGKCPPCFFDPDISVNLIEKIERSLKESPWCRCMKSSPFYACEASEIIQLCPSGFSLTLHASVPAVLLSKLITP
jgi:hypothetical protein